MAPNNSFQPSLRSARLPRPIAPDLNRDSRTSGAPAFTTTLDTALVHYNEPHSRFEHGEYNAMVPRFYQQPAQAPTTTLSPGPQVPAIAEGPLDLLVSGFWQRRRERPLAPAPPAPPGNETKADKPVIKRRTSRPRKNVQGKPIEKKVSLACLRCRGHKYKCSGEKPKCKRCMGIPETCVYVPGRRQLGKKAVEAANRAPEHFDQSGPVETAPPESPYLQAPERRILPRPTAPAAASGGSAAGPEVKTQYAEPDGGLRELASGLEEGPPHAGFSWELGGLAPDLGEGLLYPEFTLESGILDVGYNWGFQHDRPANPEFGGYPPLLSEPLPVLPQPGFVIEGSVESPDGTLPYTRQPSIASEAATDWSNEIMQHVDDPGMGFGFNGFQQVNPDNARDPCQNIDAEILRAYYANGIS